MVFSLAARVGWSSVPPSVPPSLPPTFFVCITSCFICYIYYVVFSLFIFFSSTGVTLIGYERPRLLRYFAKVIGAILPAKLRGKIVEIGPSAGGTGGEGGG